MRAERCLNCGGPMPVGLRIDAHFCKSSCRTLAYRIRKRTGGPVAKPGRSTPKWAEGKTPVVGSALASLADLQARILRVAHQLEQEDLAFRHPHPAAQADLASAAREAPPGPREIGAPADLAARHRWQDLVATLGQAEAALAEAREQGAKSARQLDALRSEWEPLPETATPAKQQAEAAGAPVNDPQPADSIEVSLRQPHGALAARFQARRRHDASSFHCTPRDVGDVPLPDGLVRSVLWAPLLGCKFRERSTGLCAVAQ